MISNPTSRDHNKASVLHTVLSQAPLTRNKLIELTGLSKATVSRAVEELRTDGFIVDRGVDEVTGRGRRSTYLDVPGTTGHVAGVSFDAQTTCVLITDLMGREVEQVVLPTADHDDVGTAAARLAGLITEARAAALGPLRQIVVALPAHVRDGAEVVRPAESMKVFAGTGFQRAVEELAGAPVLLESDANASLLKILTDHATIRNAALFSVGSTLNFGACTDHEVVRGRTTAFGDIGVLPSGVDGETLDGLLSSPGLLRFGRSRGLGLEQAEDLWLQPHDDASRAEVVEAFTTAVATAVCAAVVTLDPDSVHFAGPLRPLVDEVLPQVHARLGRSLPAVPLIKTSTQVIGQSTARGAVCACLGIVQNRLRDAVLDARRQGRPADQSPAPAF